MAEVAASKEFGRAIREARERQDLTLEQAAGLLGVSHAYWWRLEQGFENPTFATCTKLADILDHIFKPEVIPKPQSRRRRLGRELPPPG